ncbi:Tetratricopeptide repeat-containing protein [Sinomicrobium oceani]|uniref:Tetratricopeptide repeat-containing protein n=1 Tax=Sinomicrobium oceani TaxID=1150368 RepID=A0A1K1NTU7_9FLAO|nr:tetratricopeptide repeat protein [Sinomicrobium oceani]SFW38743.1 Tetratricopeptide repeat-containing protein [Sinomicrobium oceani]
MGKLKRYFKYIIIVFIPLILLIGTGVLWWSSRGDSEKSDLLVQIGTYEAALQYNQENSKALMERSVAFNKAGDFQTGFQYLDRAVDLNPREYLGYRGWIRLRKMRDYEKALSDFNRLDSLTPNFVDAPWGEDIDFLRGECYFGKKDYTHAIKLFERSIENQGEDWADVQTFVYLGLCHYELRNHEKSIKEFQRALKQSDKICEAYFGLAKVHLRLGEKEKAKNFIEKAAHTISHKRDDVYNEYLNEIYLSEILAFKKSLN